MRALPDEAERRRVSGCNGHYKFVQCAGAKARPYDRTVGRAKSVTNNLPILSVLGGRGILVDCNFLSKCYIPKPDQVTVLR